MKKEILHFFRSDKADNLSDYERYEIMLWCAPSSFLYDVICMAIDIEESGDSEEDQEVFFLIERLQEYAK